MGSLLASLILVVDDDPAVRDSLCAVLEGAGYRTLAAENGQVAVAQLADEPDLILTDMNMAGANGIGVINAVVERGGTIPVIAMSSWEPVGFDPLEVALKVGAVRALHKDRMEDLLEVVETTLAARF